MIIYMSNSRAKNKMKKNSQVEAHDKSKNVIARTTLIL